MPSKYETLRHLRESGIWPSGLVVIEYCDPDKTEIVYSSYGRTISEPEAMRMIHQSFRDWLFECANFGRPK